MIGVEAHQQLTWRQRRLERRVAELAGGAKALQQEQQAGAGTYCLAYGWLRGSFLSCRVLNASGKAQERCLQSLQARDESTYCGA